MSFGDFAEVVILELFLAGIVDGAPLNGVVSTDGEFFAGGSIERIKKRGAERQENRNCKQLSITAVALFRKKKAPETVRPKQIPRGTEETIRPGRDRMPSHRLEIHAIPRTQIVLGLGSANVQVQPLGLVN